MKNSRIKAAANDMPEPNKNGAGAPKPSHSA